jgi:hypothetical protein
MPIARLRDPIPALKARAETLKKATDLTFRRELRALIEFIDSQPLLRVVVNELARTCSDAECDAWYQAEFGKWRWPDSEEKHAAVAMWLIRRMAPNAVVLEHIQQSISWTRYHNGFLQIGALADLFVIPLVQYLSEHIASGSEVLHAMARYKHAVEWFDRDELYRLASVKKRERESTYDLHLQRFLFDHELIVYRQTRSPSGIADVAAGLESADPLVCEIKLYEPPRYGIAYVAQGVSQAFKYARDHQKPTAYLVVIDLQEEHVLRLPSDTGDAWPPTLQIDSVAVRMVLVHGLRTKSASKSGSLTTLDVSRESLVAGG